MSGCNHLRPSELIKHRLEVSESKQRGNRLTVGKQSFNPRVKSGAIKDDSAIAALEAQTDAQYFDDIYDEVTH